MSMNILILLHFHLIDIIETYNYRNLMKEWVLKIHLQYRSNSLIYNFTSTLFLQVCNWFRMNELLVDSKPLRKYIETLKDIGIIKSYILTKFKYSFTSSDIEDIQNVPILSNHSLHDGHLLLLRHLLAPLAHVPSLLSV